MSGCGTSAGRRPEFPVCRSCGDEFELAPNKPGFRDQCPDCGRAEEASRGVARVVASGQDHVNGFVPTVDFTAARMEALAAHITQLDTLLSAYDARLARIKRRFALRKKRIRKRRQLIRRELKELTASKKGARVPGLDL